MTKQIAFLRSINVGNRRVTGADLAGLFSQLKLDNPASFLTSGNVIFETETTRNLSQRIENHLHKSLGYQVPILLRSANELRNIAQATPFTPAQLEASAGKVQVSLLHKAPSRSMANEILSMETDEDLLTIQGQELYWLPRGGMSDSSLDVLKIESLLGLQTRRTLNTIQRLTEKFLT